MEKFPLPKMDTTPYRHFPQDRPSDGGVGGALPGGGVTEQEAEVRAIKMDALRRISGRLAHELGNQLTVVTGGASLALMRAGLPEEAATAFRSIYTAGMRAGAITRRLRLVAEDAEELHLRPLDLGELLRAVVAESGAGGLVRPNLRVADDLPPVAGDAELLERVFQNLAANARAAMPDGGELRVAAHAEEDGREVCIVVSDTGSGVSPDVLPRVFEPFFTTRGSDGALGLGLAEVDAIVRRHRGRVKIESQAGEGTVLRLSLPAADGAARERSASGGETILLVEDDRAVREFTREALRAHGYRVLLAGSGAEALETWKWHASRIGLLLTDLVLPDGPSGLELAQSLRAETPGLKVVCVSGHPRDVIDRLCPVSAGIRFLQKPYSLQVLMRAVRECLDESPVESG